VRLEHVNRECIDRIDHLETDNHFHETQFDDRDAINKAQVRQIWRTAEAVVQDNIDQSYLAMNCMADCLAEQRTATQQQQLDLTHQKYINVNVIDTLLEKQSRHKKALRELAIRSDQKIACLRKRLSELEYAFNLLPVGLASEEFKRSLVLTSHLKQEDLGETPRKRKTPPTPFQTETRSKRASVAMIINQPIN